MESRFLNKGISIKPGVPCDPAAGRTFIVSGVGRGGTTMLANVLQESGLPMGEHLADFVGEDMDMLEILRRRDMDRLRTLIALRNQRHRDWGFKLPNIPAFLRYGELDCFRNPHLILIFRDPQAIAVRSRLAEHDDPLAALRDAGSALMALIEFIDRTRCPTLILSYEKALVFPAAFLDALMHFCGRPPDAAMRARLLDRVQPNAPEYIEGARRTILGRVEYLRDGVLYGWCCEEKNLGPVALELFIDGHRAGACRADVFREDLLKAGFGNGIHGFALPLAGVESGARLEVRVAGKALALENSGRTVGDYGS